jgi:heme/copper-type cytochrome/quinol oxidase subunit 1
MITKLMPRRIPDYPDSFEGWNLVSSFGSIISIVATVLFIYIIYDTLAQPEDQLANDPWAVPAFFTSPRGAGITKTATTLEWAITSPPAFHAFEGQLPVQSVNTPPYKLFYL